MTGKQTPPAGDYDADSTLVNGDDSPVYGEAQLRGDIELRYNNYDLQEYSDKRGEEYHVIITTTTFGLGRDLFGTQKIGRTEDEAQHLLDTYAGGSWDYVE